jgi:hypothetical protein
MEEEKEEEELWHDMVEYLFGLDQIRSKQWKQYLKFAIY